MFMHYQLVNIVYETFAQRLETSLLATTSSPTSFWPTDANNDVNYFLYSRICLHYHHHGRNG